MSEQKTPIYRFGETATHKWYEDSNGNKIDCGEAEIEMLWKQWVMMRGVKGGYEGEYLVSTAPKDSPMYL
jgi:hypothetical protein